MSEEPIRVEERRSTLLIVDVQPDFLPGGALAVDDGDEILEPIRELAERDLFDLCVATQDWHPPDHVSFASNHEGREPFETIELYGHEQTLWPDHCVQGTQGAELHSRVPGSRVDAVVRKATTAECDSYSAFRNNWNPDGERPPTGLAGYLRERGVESLFLCGLARDYCVKWSAEDAADEGFETWFLWDLTRAIDPADDERVRDDLEERGVRVVESARLAP